MTSVLFFLFLFTYLCFSVHWLSNGYSIWRSFLIPDYHHFEVTSLIKSIYFCYKLFQYPFIVPTRNYLIWFGWVLWHTNHCRLFNAKSSLYLYIKYIWFGLFGFYGIPTIVGYLMLNPLYTYILNIYDLVWLGFMAYQPLQVI